MLLSQGFTCAGPGRQSGLGIYQVVIGEARSILHIAYSVPIQQLGQLSWLQRKDSAFLRAMVNASDWQEILQTGTTKGFFRIC